MDKSTVPVGTADLVRQTVAERALAQRGVELPFSVVSNPEFLKEGAAVEDFMKPDRIVVGTDDERAAQLMRALYAPFQRNHERMLVMDVKSAELTKYAANAMLATRISFMNELANLAERLGANIEQVRLGHRLGPAHRLPLPVRRAAATAAHAFPRTCGRCSAPPSRTAPGCASSRRWRKSNEAQKQVLLDKLTTRFGADFKGRRFALWGLAFKPNTDDMREAPSRVVIDGILARGGQLMAYDPVATQEARRLYGDQPSVSFPDSPLAALDGADALIIATEWKEFRSPDFADLKRRLKQPLIFDGRNLYDPAMVKAAGLEYYSIGRA